VTVHDEGDLRHDPSVTQYETDANLAARQRLWTRSPREGSFDTFAWLASMVQGERALEIGCGNGRYLERIDGCIGLDLSSGMLDAARARVGTRPLVQGDAQALPFADASFDTVLAPMMLYHVPDRAQAAREMHRVLRPGGVAIATTNTDRAPQSLRELVEAVVGNGWRWGRVSADIFSMENGAEQLAVAFDSVERMDYPPTVVHVVDAELLAGYVGSVADPWADDVRGWIEWDDVVDECRHRAHDVIQRDGSFDIELRGGAFICR
jgi:SAM-dependent methyltransferase